MQLFGLGWKDEWEGAAWGAGPESCPHAAAPASGPAAWAERQRLHRVEDAETLTWINASPWEVVGFPPSGSSHEEARSSVGTAPRRVGGLGQADGNRGAEPNRAAASGGAVFQQDGIKRILILFLKTQKCCSFTGRGSIFFQCHDSSTVQDERRSTAGPKATWSSATILPVITRAGMGWARVGAVVLSGMTLKQSPGLIARGFPIGRNSTCNENIFF